MRTGGIRVALTHATINGFRPGKIACFRAVRQHILVAMSVQWGTKVKMTDYHIEHTHPSENPVGCRIEVTVAAEEITQ